MLVLLWCSRVGDAELVVLHPSWRLLLVACWLLFCSVAAATAGCCVLSASCLAFRLSHFHRAHLPPHPLVPTPKTDKPHMHSEPFVADRPARVSDDLISCHCQSAITSSSIQTTSHDA